MNRARVKAVPGGTVAPMVGFENFGAYGVGGHGWVGFIPDVVVAGYSMGFEPAFFELCQCFVQCTCKVGGVGVFLDQVAQVDREVGIDICGQTQSCSGTLTLVAARGEFEWGVAGVEHVVSVGNDGELELGFGEQGEVEESLVHGFVPISGIYMTKSGDSVC